MIEDTTWIAENTETNRDGGSHGHLEDTRASED